MEARRLDQLSARDPAPRSAAQHAEHTIGSRWMGFATPQGPTSYGIHGTVDADSIGKSESEGCIRLLKDDVEALFELIPEGGSVTVVR